MNVFPRNCRDVRACLFVGVAFVIGLNGTPARADNLPSGSEAWTTPSTWTGMFSGFRDTTGSEGSGDDSSDGQGSQDYANHDGSFGNYHPSWASDRVANEREPEPIFTEALKKKILAGIDSSFALPFRQLYEKKYDNEFENLFSGLSANFSLDVPLDRSETISPSAGVGQQGSRTGNTPVLKLGIKYNPLSYWACNITFSKYWDKELQASFNGDFSYSCGYDDWHPYTLSFNYSNYGGNRLNPDRSKGEHVTVFEQGTFALGWKFPVPQQVARIFTFEEDGAISCNLGLDGTPRYNDIASNSVRKWKMRVSLGCKVALTSWWYLNWTAYYYPWKNQQQPFDPDYTYGFGYFDWHPGTVSVQLNNYSGNRYPWRKQNDDSGRFLDGAISVSYSWSFD